MNGLIDDLKQRGIEVEGQFKDFSFVDSDVETAGVLTKNQIVPVVQSEPYDASATEKEDGFDEPIQYPSFQ